jgi:hypothetical protein
LAATGDNQMIAVSETWSAERVAELRVARFRQRPDLRLNSLEDAASFVDDVGLCLFQGKGDDDLPNLYGAVAGRPGPAPGWGAFDDAAHRSWSWKDQLFSNGLVYYGKPLGNYRLLVGRRLLPYLQAACSPGPTYAEEDYLELYEDGLLTADARQLYEALLPLGAASTARLRRAAYMDTDKRAARRFEKALTDLQRSFLVAAVGVDDDNAWKYTFRYAPLVRAFPDEVEQASRLSTRDAMTWLVRWFLDLAGAVPAARVARLFGWDSQRLERVLAAMAESGAIARHAGGILTLADRS